jgi:hypothetical protein
MVQQSDQAVRRIVLESAKRLLAERRPGQSPITVADVAADTALDVQLVCAAVKSLAADHLSVKAYNDWAYAEIHSVGAELD